MPVEALFFDVFGTLADWRSGISRDAKRILGAGPVAEAGGSEGTRTLDLCRDRAAL